MSKKKVRKGAASKLDRASLEKIAKVFGAFSDATRLAILQELKEGARSVGELVQAIGVSQGSMSKQLQHLSEAGILLRDKQGTQVFYSIADEMVFTMCGLVCDKLNRDREASASINFSI